MTVSYQYEVASSTSGGFTRLLFMWKGSLYKLIYRELLLFLVAFGILSALYRNAFTPDQKRLFEKVVIYCDTFINLIPLSFVLGFYVAYVANRWWQQFMAIPWPDKTMHSLALYVNGNDEQSRMIRRTLMRYLNLSLVLVLRSISSAVKRRLPTMDHLVEAGFMTKLELDMFQSVPNEEFNTYWIPCTWFVNLLKETKRSNRINDSQGLKIIMEEFNEFRSKCGLLWSYDWISIPLVYTQVVTIATYSFFLAALIGRQYVEESRKQLQMEIDIYLPVFTILQFFFFMGLLKVAEQLINPFGDDDEDFELNWLIDRHTKVSYLGVDVLMARTPPLVKDKYFDDFDVILPYTGAAFAYKKKTYRGSVHDMIVPEDQQSMFLPETVLELEEEDEYTPPKTPKNSVSSIFTTSPSAGIWRQNGGSCDVESGMPPTEEIPRRQEDAGSMNLNVLKDKVTNSSEIKRWDSNTTIDSFCSVREPDPLDNEDERVKSEVERLRRLNELSLAKMAPFFQSRKMSSGSCQWKGVRWKPVHPVELAGATWLKKAARRHSMAQCAAINKRLTLPELRSVSESERETPPLKEPPAAQSSPSLQSVEIGETNPAYNHIDSTAISLPNIAVKPHPDP